jgi:hypothetical protein
VNASSSIQSLLVRYELADIPRLDRRNHRRLAQMSFSLFVLRRQNMPFESFIAFDLSAGGQAKSFRCRSVGFDFWHWDTPLANLTRF